METNDSPATFSVARLISFLNPNHPIDILSDILHKIAEQSRMIFLLQGHPTLGIVRPNPQATENIDDAKDQPKGTFTSLEGTENTKSKNTFDFFDKPRKATGLQRVRRTNGTTGPGLRTLDGTTKNSLSKVRKKRNFLLWIFLSMMMITGAEGRNEHIKYVTINESVTLSLDATDLDAWLLSPASNPSEYSTLYLPGEGSRERVCGGYRFGKDHSIIIDTVQRCHAGTYTAEYLNSDSLTIVLIVNDNAEVTTLMETTTASDIIKHASSSDKELHDIENTVKIPLTIVACISMSVAATCIVIIILLKWKRKKIENKSSANEIKDSVNYTAVDRTEEV